MSNIINIAQIVVSVLLITFILLQQRGAALGSAFGGEGGSFYSTRRGIEKKIYWATVVCAIIFLLLAIFHLII